MKSFIYPISLMLLIPLYSCESTSNEKTKPVDKEMATIEGTWRMSSHQTQSGNEMVMPSFTQIKIYTGNRFFLINYNEEDNQFLMALGGKYTREATTFKEYIEYYSEDSTLAGSIFDFDYTSDAVSYHQSGILKQEGVADIIIAESYERLELGIAEYKAKNKLLGVWKMEKAAYNKMEEAVPLPDGQETYKVITPGHFYVVQSKLENGYFDGVVFGTYKLENNKYIETIHTTSRDSTIIGLSVTYDYEANESTFIQKGELNAVGLEGYKVEEYYIREE